MQKLEHYAVAIILVFSFVVQLEAVTVNPIAHLCPTNKIAPRRKRYEYYHPRPRTFGQFYNLLKPNSPGSLQEQPLDDEPIDCSEIQDYDENDIGSITQSPLRRHGYQRTFLKKGSSNYQQPADQHLLHQHSQQGIRPSTRPTRPPPAGYFGTNNYTPPQPQEPTDYVKPVSEQGGSEGQAQYRPGVIVGAPLYHVVGLPQVQKKKPHHPPAPSTETNHRDPKYYPGHKYLPATQSSNGNNNHHRQRKYNGDTGILGSFVDLFF